MRKYALLVLVVVLLGVFSLTAAQDEITLEFWGGWTGPDGAIMQELVDRYSAENPNVNVNLTIQAWSPLFDAFIAAASAGESPDIMAMHPQETAMFINLGLIGPVDDIVANSSVFVEENYVPKAWELQFYNGQMYAFPFDLGVHGLFYNVALFEEAGIAAPPSNAEELLEAARLLTKDANGNHPGDEGFDPANIVQYAINMHTNHHAFYQWYALYNQLGGQLLSEDGTQCAMDIDKATRAWQWLQDLVYVNYAAPQGQTDYARDFIAGRTAMLVDGPWQIPALQAAAAESGFRWASAPYPTIFDQPAVWGSGHNFTLPTNADPEKRDEAIAFIEWLAENSFSWLASGQLPIRQDIIASPEFAELEGRQSFVDMLANQKLLPNIPKFSEIFASNAPTPMMVMAQRILLEQADVRSTVQTACDEITAILSIP
ncbi:MAG: ABC transporter substrate-binding protein [Chloroflexi bacterium]|nr:ABC transporter substrate-binding protein [Chloroflexota bacterium]